MRITIAKEIFNQFPSTVLGVVVVKGINNRIDDHTIPALLRAEESRIRATINKENLSARPEIVAWREAYKKFGVKPSDARSSVESLYRSVLNGRDIRRVNPLVDLYNYISLRYMLPAGAEDLTQINGDIELTFAGPNEPAILLLGDDKPEVPPIGEVIYRDNNGAICRRWNWREADRTKIIPQTKDCIIVLERLEPIEVSSLEGALKETCEGVSKLLGGEAKSILLNQSNQTTSI